MESIDWNRIENFIGYGRLNAPVVFVGMEEGVGGGKNREPDATKNERLIADLVKRSSYETIRDIEAPSKITSSWGPMCELMLRRDGYFRSNEDQKTYRDRIRQYQKRCLGKADGDTLLMELLPYPRASMMKWPEAYEGRFKCEHTYRKVMLARRSEMLKREINAFDRELIVFYGTGYAQTYKDLFKSEWREEDGFHIAKRGNTLAMISPHFSSRAFSQRRIFFYELVTRMTTGK